MGKQGEAKIHILSEIIQSKKALLCMSPTIWHCEKGKTMEKLKISVVSRGEVDK